MLRPETLRLLQSKGPALKKHMKLSTEFWDALIYNHVLSYLEVDEFQVGIQFCALEKTLGAEFQETYFYEDICDCLNDALKVVVS